MRRKTWAVAALAIVLVCAGCGGTRSSGGGTGNGGTNAASPHAKAVKFAACMRANGVSAFADPDAAGELTIDAVANGSSLDTSSAAFEQALSACKDLEPPGFTGHKRSAQQQANALKYAQCIRDNGIEDFPDPTPDGPLIDTSRMPGSPGARSIPGFAAAMEACRDIPQSAGVTRGQ
jgi:hypothetical protein